MPNNAHYRTNNWWGPSICGPCQRLSQACSWHRPLCGRRLVRAVGAARRIQIPRIVLVTEDTIFFE